MGSPPGRDEANHVCISLPGLRLSQRQYGISVTPLEDFSDGNVRPPISTVPSANAASEGMTASNARPPLSAPSAQ